MRLWKTLALATAALGFTVAAQACNHVKSVARQSVAKFAANQVETGKAAPAQTTRKPAARE